MSEKQRANDSGGRFHQQHRRSAIAARIGFLNIKSSIITNETRAVDIVDNLKHLQRLMGQHQQELNTNVLLKSELNQNVQSFVSFVQPVSGHQVNEFNDLNVRINSLAGLTYNTLKQTGVFRVREQPEDQQSESEINERPKFERRSADAIGPATECDGSLRVQQPTGQQRYPTERDPQSA